ncbi:hypothetical protein BBJ29_002661 [Phytophthora kernoviae]|uniref:Expansin-like EG45 domain-containing protein n=1 Tax=Phytophthora kernoviae TaxID=325452 RepID=A0A3F2RTW1_9STRA|nr:hypothetical protein BBJ29_002661 [Phytophthora kernoviae]RLN63113.1 hypothetical protein BBP00_00004310 [Phytophthora kernoviae]
MLAAAATLALINADEYFTGDGTTYTLGDTSAGNCNYMKALGFASNNYAALNDKQWNGLKNCGRCAEYGDLDLSPTVFSSLTGSSPSRYKVKWKFVDCPVQGNVNYCLKGDSNNYWTAIQPTNVPTGVTDLQINGKSTKMLDGAYYYLLDGSGQQIADLSSVTVSLTDLSGNSVKDTMSLSSGSCADAGSDSDTNSGRYYFANDNAAFFPCDHSTDLAAARNPFDSNPNNANRCSYNCANLAAIADERK